MGRQSRRGRGDRGRGGYHKKKSPTQDIKEKYYKFKPHGQGKDKQNVFYGKIVDKILMKIEATYEHGADITWSIENKQKFDSDAIIPTMTADEAEDVATKLIFEKKVESWLERQCIFDANWSKAFSFIFQNYYMTTMQGALKELEN